MAFPPAAFPASARLFAAVRANWLRLGLAPAVDRSQRDVGGEAGTLAFLDRFRVGAE